MYFLYLVSTAPSGELLMVRVMPENDSVVRLEYTSRFTGTPQTVHYLLFPLQSGERGGKVLTRVS